MPNPRILIICSVSNSLVNFRGDLITALVKNNFNVFCAAPEFEKQETRNKLHSLGAKTATYSLQRTGLNPIKDIKSIRNLKEIILENQIDLVFPYTIKPVIYGSIAAKTLGVPVISLITGLGFTFSGVNLKARMLQQLTQVLYRYSLNKNKMVVFQNTDDQQLFLEKNILQPKQPSTVVNGSGVNLERFPFRSHQKKDSDTIVFIIVGRLLKEKGVAHFLEAAKILKSRYPNTEFHLVGAPSDDDPSGISNGILKKLHEEGIIVYHKTQPNVVPFLTNADVFVLPTYYREGVPRSILEALSIGMPIITTNMPGCKETVLSKTNGFLIPPKELDPLIDAMTYFIDYPEQIDFMGKASRALAEKKFDVDIINRNLINIIKRHL